jgi:DNA-binding transcriptional LysR family regulator
MSWENTNFDWNYAKAFMVAVEKGSFTSAAKELKISQTTLGRQITAFEEDLGMTLFLRGGNKTLELTESGHDLLEYVQVMADSAKKLSLRASGKTTTLEGIVRISASEAEAVYSLPRIVKKIRQTWPGIIVEIVASNKASNLEKREADIAIRNFKPKGQNLIIKQLKDTHAYLYASPGYLESINYTGGRGCLSGADVIVTPEIDEQSMLNILINSFKMNVTTKNLTVLTKNQSTYWELVKSGVGIGVMPSHIGDNEKTVVRVDKNSSPVPFGNWIVAHSELNKNPRIRLVYDFIADEFQKILAPLDN